MIITFVVTLVALYVTFGPRDRKPNIKDLTSWAAIKANLAQNLKLGLDLKGGSHLVLQVQADDAVRKLTEGNVSEGRELLKKDNVPFEDIRMEGLGHVVVTTKDGARNKDIVDKLLADYDRNSISGRGWEKVKEEPTRIEFALKETEATDIRRSATEQAKSVIENRINALGVSEPTVQLHGPESSHQILVQLPGVDDPERVKELIRGESNLELYGVVGALHSTKEEAEATRAGASNQKVVPFAGDRGEAEGEGGAATGWLVVEMPPVVTGLDMRDASAVPSRAQSDIYEVIFSLKQGGGEKFYQWTSGHVGKNLAISLNDTVKSYPSVKEPIRDRVSITGGFTKQSADDLALVLRSGALPAKIVYLLESTVGPSLGVDSIKMGITSSLVGLALIVVFLFYYYRVSGINAVLALVLNLVLLMGGLAMLSAVLTLPGIAGIILTIGMAVDANVLVFERIREELRNGKVVVSAVDAGFKRALGTIIDTHVTTIVSAIFLFVFGTGPIRGFAVTLIIGLIANIFTAVYVSRGIFDYVITRGGQRAETLSI